MTLTFEVRGTPVPQGSIRSLGKGRPSIHGNAEQLHPWRNHVQIVAQQALAGAGPIVGAVEVSLSFYLAKPKSTPKKAVWPMRRPDLDKLVRGVADALTAAGVFLDDAQVVALTATKAWAVPPRVPGVVIRVGAAATEVPLEGGPVGARAEKTPSRVSQVPPAQSEGSTRHGGDAA